jgi:hypothetical protein
MTKPTQQGSTIFAPASRVDGQLTELLDLRLEQPARQERATVRRADWVAATDCAPEGGKRQEVYQRGVGGRRA